MSTAQLQRETLPAAVSLLEGRELLEEESLCLNVRGRAEHCSQCADACHSGALALSPDAIEVDREKCTGCGGCVPACPAGALRLTGFSPARFLAALDSKAEAHLHCTESGDEGGGVVVPCFKVLDERLFSAAAAGGVNTLYLHGLDRCRACRHGGAMRQVARMRLRLKRWLGEGAPDVRTATGNADDTGGPRQRQDQPHLSRRSFLRFAGARAVQEAAYWLVPAEEDDDGPGLPFFQGDTEEIRQPHAFQSLLAERVAEVPWNPGAALPWRLRTLSEHCTACLACGQRCPTGALLAQAGDDTQGLSFEPALCTDCGLCEALCPVDAIQARPARRAAEVSAPRTVLMMRRAEACDHCGTGFLPETPGVSTCPICTNEQDLDEEWMAMLGG